MELEGLTTIIEDNQRNINDHHSDVPTTEVADVASSSPSEALLMAFLKCFRTRISLTDGVRMTPTYSSLAHKPRHVPHRALQSMRSVVPNTSNSET